MSCVRPLLFVLFVSVSLQAQSVVIIQGQNGWYVPPGSSIAESVGRVIRLGPGEDPIPDPDPDPDPELEQLSSMWPTKVAVYSKRDAHRQGQMAMFSVLATQAAAGKFSDLDQAGGAEQALRELVLGDDKLKWSEWYAPIGVYLVANVSSVDELAPAYRAIAAGLSKSGEAIDSGWVKLIEIIIESLGEGTIPPLMLALIKILLEILGG